MFFVHANFAETVFAAQRATGLIEGKDARYQFPQP